MNSMKSNRRLSIAINAIIPVALILFSGNALEAADKKNQNSVAAKPPLANQDKSGMPDSNLGLIKVDDQVITTKDYIDFLQRNPQIISRAAHSEVGKRNALRELVGVLLLQKAMFDEGLLNKNEENKSSQQVVAAYEKLAEKHFPLPPNPDDTAGYSYYESHLNDFGIPPMIRMNEILFKLPPKADEAVEQSVKQRAEKALKRINDGEKFSVVAVEMTENPIGRVAGGDIGFVEVEKEAWMKEATKDLKPGQHTSILKSPDGYVLLEVSDIRPGLISPYANVRDKVIKNLRDVKQRELRDPYVQALAKNSKIEVIAPEIKGLFPNGVFNQ